MSIISGAELDAMKFEPLNWCVEGIIPEGLGVVAGAPKIGKSWMAADIALACAGGGVALGHFPVQARPVLYLALEDGERRLQHRFRQLMGGHPIPDIAVCIDIPVALEQAHAFIREHATDKPLVILDTFGKVMATAGKPSYGDDYRQMSQLMEMQKQSPGSTFLVIHHTRKADASDFVDKLSGTSGIAGAADFIIVVNRERGESSGSLSVTGRDIPEADYTFALADLNGGEGFQWQVSPDSHKRAAKFAENQKFSENTNATLTVVRSREETTPADVAAEIGIDSKRAGEILARLVKRGLVSKIRWGVYKAAESAESAEIPGQEGEGSPHMSESAETGIRSAEVSAEMETTPDQEIPHSPHKPHTYDTPASPDTGRELWCAGGCDNLAATDHDYCNLDHCGSELPDNDPAKLLPDSQSANIE
ncbi:AAA family ATPase [Mycolicibacterium neoaurum]|uniref:AAA family ATPase n=1 Tax=Mycolicibacterium neoaurum TaxID=1795 RepID=UPI001BCC8CCF|nr:AAA family ATPase [Mycolicibacterium neoaurum]QVI29929.1 AAA family ATPase [Mycolicibacterium neoaurum]